MTSLQRASLAAVVLWVVVNGALAVSTRSESAAPAVHLAAFVLLAGAIGWTVRPLGGRVPVALPSWQAWALVLVVPVVGAAVSVNLSAGSQRGYANWWAGATGPLVAGLVMRGRTGAAAVAVAAEVVVLTGSTLVATWPAPDVITIVLLAQPPVVCLLGAETVRRVQRSTQRTVDLWGGTAAGSLRSAEQARARARLALRRREEIVALVGPTLRRAADGEPAGGTALLEAHLRDLLRARALVDPAVRAAAAAARGLGAEVVLVDDREPGVGDPDLPSRVRRALLTLLPHLDGGSLTARLGPSGREATLVVQPDASGGRPRRRLDPALRALGRDDDGVVLDVDEDDVLVTFAGGATWLQPAPA